MQRVLSIILIISVIFAGGYFYRTASAVCDAPIAYRIGAIDPSFGISEDEARNAVADAESLWEDKTGRNLFTYDESAAFTINFIYDARQQLTDAELELTEQLEEKRTVSEEIRMQYETLLAQYETLIENYEAETNAYNERLDAHNQMVEKWNEQGGAPQSVYAELERERSVLEAQQRELDQTARTLSSIAKQINTLGDRGNIMVAAYNNVVSAYNRTFSHEREFTQGDYQGGAIHIYQYEDLEELQLVLAHELGHALSLDHVEGEDSIMHFLMGGQSYESGLTDADLKEFENVCGEGSLTLFPARWRS